MDEFRLMHVVYFLLLLLLIAPAGLALARRRGTALRDAAIWLAVLVALVLAFRLLGPL